MTTSFDFHDTISVVVPGTCAVVLFGFFYCEGWADFWQPYKELSAAFSLVLLIPCYVVGELIQKLGKWAVNELVYPHCGGDPYLWVLKQDEKPSFYAAFLPSKSCREVRESLKSVFGWERLGKTELNSAFYYLKMKVYAHDAYRQECIKMLTKLHLFSSLLVLCVLTPFVYAVIALSSDACDTATYCFEHNSFTFQEICHYSRAGFFFICFLCGACGSEILKCILEFSRSYNRCLYSSYLAIVEKEKARTPNS